MIRKSYFESCERANRRIQEMLDALLVQSARVVCLPVTVVNDGVVVGVEINSRTLTVDGTATYSRSKNLHTWVPI